VISGAYLGREPKRPRQLGSAKTDSGQEGPRVDFKKWARSLPSVLGEVMF